MILLTVSLSLTLLNSDITLSLKAFLSVKFIVENVLSQRKKQHQTLPAWSTYHLLISVNSVNVGHGLIDNRYRYRVVVITVFAFHEVLIYLHTYEGSTKSIRLKVWLSILNSFMPSNFFSIFFVATYGTTHVTLNGCGFKASIY